MNKPIIIDGVDVSECEFKSLFDNRCCSFADDSENLNCNNKDCYYKQLQRVISENEKLLKELQYKYEEIDAKGFLLMGEDLNFWKNLKAENEELKKRNEELDKMTGIYSHRLMERYKQALEDVRESIKNMCEENCPDLKNGYCIGINECAQRSQKHITRLINEVLK